MVTTPENVLGSNPDGDGFCSFETKHETRMALRQYLFGGITRTKVTNPKNCSEFKPQ